jgi:uncharacterized membrane protein
VSSETSRVEAFSDGVFAVAITLLIFQVKTPPAGSGALAEELLRQWPSYFSFAISFMFIGIMWINHHRLFTHINRCDNVLLSLNLLLLMGVTFVPFPTSVLAVHLLVPDRRAAAILFNGTYLAIAIFFNLLWRYAASPHRHLIPPGADNSSVARITRQYAIGPLSYLVCFVLSWVSVPASLAFNLLLAFYFAIPPRSRRAEA